MPIPNSKDSPPLFRSHQFQFPTCQVTVARFYVSLPPFSSSFSPFFPPDLNCKLEIAVVPARPPLQAADCSRPRQTRTASSGRTASPNPKCKQSEWFLPDSKDQNGPCRTSTASPRSQWSLPDPKSKPRSHWSLPDPKSKPMVLAGPQRIPEEISDRMLERMLEDMPDRMSEYMSDRLSEDRYREC